MDARVAVVQGDDDDADSLWEWLRREPELRGLIRLETATAETEDSLGAVVDVAVALSTAAGAVSVALARSLSAWLVERERRRSTDTTIAVTGPDGRRVEVSVRRGADAERLVRTVLDARLHGEELGPDRDGGRDVP